MTRYFKTFATSAISDDGKFIQVSRYNEVYTISAGIDRGLCNNIERQGHPIPKHLFDAALESAVASMTNNLEAINF